MLNLALVVCMLDTHGICLERLNLALVFCVLDTHGICLQDYTSHLKCNPLCVFRNALENTNRVLRQKIMVSSPWEVNLKYATVLSNETFLIAST